MLAREFHHLRHLGLGDLVGVDAAIADTVVMHMQHDAGRLLLRLAEEPLQHVHDELHRRVVVVEQQHTVHVRPLDARLGLRDDRRAGAAASLPIASRGAMRGPHGPRRLERQVEG